MHISIVCLYGIFIISVTKKTKMNNCLMDYLSFSKEERIKQREMRARQHEEKLLSFKRIENLLHKMLEKENKSGN